MRQGGRAGWRLRARRCTWWHDQAAEGLYSVLEWMVGGRASVNIEAEHGVVKMPHSRTDSWGVDRYISVTGVLVRQKGYKKGVSVTLS